MKFVIQRVHKAAVKVRGNEVARIGKGLFVLAGIKQGDTEEEARWLIDKTLKMRIFEDADGKMNISVADAGGALLLVPNFTLYADASQGNRPGFGAAEAPAKARRLYDTLVSMAAEEGSVPVQSGKFGADMDVGLVNDGPVTIILEK